MNDEFVNLSEEELNDINGGVIGYFIAGGVLVVGTLVGDHYLCKNTGRDAIGWVGYGMKQAGSALQNFGQALMN